MGIIKDDLFRYVGKRDALSMLKTYILVPGFRYSFWMRVCAYFRKNKSLFYPLFFLSFFLSFLILRHYQFKYGIDISAATKIGKGFYIGHFSCIVISPLAILGNNVNISQGVTIGYANRGNNIGAATIGNNVYIGPGAKIVGKVLIGNNVAIGANAVVTKDIPDNAVVAGIPAKIISFNGAEGYVNRVV